MKFPSSLLVAALLVFASFSSAQEQSSLNLLKNGAFTDGMANWEEVQYRNGRRFPSRVASIDAAELHNGKPSLRIDSPYLADTYCKQDVGVKPNTLYRFTGWIKVKDVEPETAGGILTVHGRIAESSPVRPMKGWTRVTLEFETGNKTTIALGPRLGYPWVAKGTAWFADLSLVEIGSVSISQVAPPTYPPTGATPAPAFYIPAPPVAPSPETQAATAALVKAQRNNLVFVSGEDASGSGFIAKYGTRNFLFTNAHVAAGVHKAGFQTLQGDKVQIGGASVAVGHDIFLMQATANGEPLEIMTGVDENTSIGDDIVVLGNAEGAGVINTIDGKIVGLGPNLIEVDAPFKPGNSGSPIIHLKSGKVIGAATYLTIRKFDSATNQPVKDPIVRRFGGIL